MGIVARSTALARVASMRRRTMRVDGLIEVERRMEYSLFARAARRSGMLLVFAVVVVVVVVVGRGWHPLLVARRRVENLAILS